MEMRDEQRVHARNAVLQQKLRSRVPGVALADAAAVDEHGPGVRHRGNALTLPDVDGGELQHAGLRRAIGEKRDDNERGERDAGWQDRAEAPAAAPDDEHGEHDVNTEQPPAAGTGAREHRRHRQPRDELHHRDGIARQPADNPARRKSQRRPEQSEQADIVARHKRRGHRPEAEQIGQHRIKRHIAEVDRGERRGKNRRAERGGERTAKKLQPAPAPAVRQTPFARRVACQQLINFRR